MATLLLIGCGKMGGAMLKRWLKARPAGIGRWCVVDPAYRKISGAAFYPDLAALPKTFAPDIVVLAVKPQDMADVLDACGACFGAKPVYLSVAAGKTLGFMASHLPPRARVVRAMPNLPALSGEGMTALCTATTLPAARKKMISSLMTAIGEVLWMPDENRMDIVTAISGSGPAYLFLFMEAMAKAGMQCGLDEATALRLVRQTVLGAAHLAEHDDFAALRKQVASPGGTTEAALGVLQKNHALEKLVLHAVQAAARRSMELEIEDKTRR